MNSSSENRVSGKIKEFFGKLTGDKHTEMEGKTENLKGKVQDKVQNAKETVSGVVDGVDQGDSSP